ncbi:hypothetical protein L0Y34_01315 [Candidatus Parcubacteria bacterium]|nr:hypothetical protein [Candidatus Parcubacteria bacterium]
METEIYNAARVLIPFVVTFAIGIILAPLLSHYLYTYKAWKKKAGKGQGMGGDKATPVFDSLHAVRETSAPRMGGILISVSVLLTAAGLFFLSLFGDGAFADFDFVNRGQTWLPLFALIVGALVGLADDILEVTREGGGLPRNVRLAIVALLAAFAGWWFYEKLDVSAVGLPFVGPVELGLLFVPFFVLVTLAIYSSGVIDGIDGLAGGVFGIIFMAYAGIAFAQEQVALAAFAAAVSGGIFAFLWFNVPPARFYLSETGSMALTLALALVAFSTDVLGGGVGVAVLPIIAIALTATVVSVVLQVGSKMFLKRKLFRIAPIHHHFEAIGWPAQKVTMRYWIITILFSILGLSIALIQ